MNAANGWQNRLVKPEVWWGRIEWMQIVMAVVVVLGIALLVIIVAQNCLEIINRNAERDAEMVTLKSLYPPGSTVELASGPVHVLRTEMWAGVGYCYLLMPNGNEVKVTTNFIDQVRSHPYSIANKK